MSQQPPKFGLRSRYLLLSSPSPASTHRALTLWSEFVSRPYTTHSSISTGLLLTPSNLVEITEDRGVLKTFGTCVDEKQVVSLVEAAFLIQKGCLKVENCDLSAIFTLLETKISEFALFSYLRRSGLVAREEENNEMAVYSLRDFRKRIPGEAMYRVATVSPGDRVVPVRTGRKVAVVDQGRVIRVLEFKRWKKQEALTGASEQHESV